MNQKTNFLVGHLSEALKAAQDIIIGVCRPKKAPQEILYLIIENDNGVFTCLSIGVLFGLQTITIGMGSCEFLFFPNDSTLTEMMKTPMEFHAWYKENGL